MTAAASHTPRILVQDGTFAVLGRSGDLHARRGTDTDGLFTRDARHLSRWQLTVDGRVPGVLTAEDGGCVLTPADSRDEPPAWTLFREQALHGGALTERVRVRSNSPTPVSLRLAVTVDADFADQFELRADGRSYPRPDARHTVEEQPDGVRLTYRRGTEWTAVTEVTATPAPHHVLAADAEPADGNADAPDAPGGAPTARTLTWRLDLPPHGTSEVRLWVRAFAPGGAEPARPASPAEAAAADAADLAAFLGDGVPALPAAGQQQLADDLAAACRQGLLDLARLRITTTGPDGETVRPPAAGVPWFLCLFGRDSLLTSAFALPYRPELASATCRALAAVQGTVHDPARLEQPGRIVHELRHGELARFRQVPFGRYYGTVDATPLFLVLVHAYTETTGETALARRLEPHVRAAVDWLLGDGGLGRHGWLVYSSDAAAGGLANQNWKDSPGSICFRDGTPATGPLAVAEAQGYAYDALVRTAALARAVYGDATWARRLEETAADLRQRFQERFWLAEDAFPALALDGEGRPVDALGSDAGHLLWSGILDADRARHTADRLLADDFFSGWGVRTLAAGQPPYHPLSYHRGSVWPHDNAVIALGLARYGFADHLRTLAEGVVAAAAAHHWRLPEVMAGYGRDEHPAPVPYPHSCSPQAWSAATPLAVLTALRTVRDAS